MFRCIFRWAGDRFFLNLVLNKALRKLNAFELIIKPVNKTSPMSWHIYTPVFLCKILRRQFLCIHSLSIFTFPCAQSRILLSHAKPEATLLSQERAINGGRKHSGTDKCSFSQARDIMFSHQGLNTPPVYSHPREKGSPGNRHMVDVP